MLKTLIKLQFKKALTRYVAQRKTNKAKGKPKKKSPALYISLWGFVCLVFALMFYVYFDMLAGGLLSIGLGWLYLIYAMTAAFALSTIGCIFLSLSQLYEAKDNEMLLSLPIPPRNILFCRMLPMYAQNVLFSALVLIPAYISFAAHLPVSVMTIVSWVFVLLLVPLLSLGVSCILGWLLAVITSKIRQKNVMTIIFSLIFMVLYFAFFNRAEELVKVLISNSMGIGAEIKAGVYPIYMTGLAATGDPLSLLIFTAVIVAFFAMVYAVISHSFIKLATAKRGAKKVKYKEKSLKVSSASWALLGKERKIFTGSPTYMLNSGLGVLVMIGGTVYAAFQFGFVENSASIMRQIFAALLPFIISFVISMGPVSAASISMEGKTLWLMQSLPVTPMQVITQKLKLHIIINAASLVPSIVLSIMLKMSVVSIIFTILMPLVFALFSGLLGLMFDLKNPKLNWNTAAEAVKQSSSVLLTLLLSVLAIAVPVAVYFISLYNGFNIAQELLFVGSTLFFAILCLPLWFWIKNNGTKKFANL